MKRKAAELRRRYGEDLQLVWHGAGGISKAVAKKLARALAAPVERFLKSVGQSAAASALWRRVTTALGRRSFTLFGGY